jgi:uncharacterized membrane protein YphA (DoxX/SURF4 family)
VRRGFRELVIERTLFWPYFAGIVLSDSALAFAVAQAQQSTRYTPAMLRLVRWVIGIVSVVFGMEHFLHAKNVPVVPLEQLMPAWIPGHAALAYVTGTVMIACGAGIVWGAKARLSATWLGFIVPR